MKFGEKNAGGVGLSGGGAGASSRIPRVSRSVETCRGRLRRRTRSEILRLTPQSHDEWWPRARALIAARLEPIGHRHPDCPWLRGMNVEIVDPFRRLALESGGVVIADVVILLVENIEHVHR